MLTAFNGLCMALADSVPGVSGGTVAFILGFYDRLINALHSLLGKDGGKRKSALKYLLVLGSGWILGLAAGVMLLARLFEENIYFLSSMFLGLTAGAIPYIISAEKACLRGQWRNLPFALLGAAAVTGLTALRGELGAVSVIDFSALEPLQYLYLASAGAVAISAMVLPGISGSTVLLISGVYIPAVSALRRLMWLDASVLPGVLALAAGVLAGAALSVRFIRRALREHRSRMMYLILGLMAGSFYSIVMGPTTVAVPVAALSAVTFSVPGFLLGLAVLMGLEALKTALSKGQRAGRRIRRAGP